MNALIEALNHASAAWWPIMLHATWQASLLAIVLLAIVRWAPRLPAPLRYWLLVLGLVKFAMPPMLALPTGVFSRLPAATPSAVAPIHSTIAASPAETTTIPPAAVALSAPRGPANDSKASKLEFIATPPRIVGASPIISPARRIAPLGWRAWLMLAHAGAVLIAAIWVLRQALGLRQIVFASEPMRDGDLAARLAAACREMRLRSTPQLLLSNAAAAPMALGILRPRIVLPAALVARLTPQELDTVLAHELAHHRRRDTYVIWLQVLLGVLWCFNPLYWLLSRALRRVREECCDDLVLARRVATSEAYCQTLLRAAEGLIGARAQGTALGFADTLHPLAGRLRRLMDRALRPAAGLSFSGAALTCLIAAFVLPGLKHPAQTALPSAAPAADDARATPGRLRIRTVEKGDQFPVANAEVVFKVDKYKQTGTTDQRGECSFEMPSEKFTWVTVDVRKAERVPMQVLWFNDGSGPPQALPATVSVLLQRATSIGGTIQNEQGVPVKGASAEIWLRGWPGQMPPTDGTPFVSVRETVSTDAQGRWRCDQVPDVFSEDQLSTRITHPDYTTSAPFRAVGLPPLVLLRDMSAVVVIQRDRPTVGVSVRGSVMDEAERPVSGASIALITGNFADRPAPGYECASGADGSFRIDGVTPGPRNYSSDRLLMIAEAPGFAPGFAIADFAPDLSPVVLKLGPGRSITGRVFDLAGMPIADAAVSPGSGLLGMPRPLWEQRHTWLKWRGRTDRDGWFIWDHAPCEGIEVAIAKDGHIRQTRLVISATDNEPVFRLAPIQHVSGSVRDARTGDPIKEFTIVDGIREFDGEVYWERPGRRFSNGRYERTIERSLERLVMRVDADGYQSEVSRVFENALEPHVRDFVLNPSRQTSGTVCLPDGMPLAGAEVFLCAGDADRVQMEFRDSAFEEQFWVPGPSAQRSSTTDASGHFSFPGPTDPYVIFARHERGCAAWWPEAGSEAARVVVEPWGRLEGTALSGGIPLSRGMIALSIFRKPSRELPGVHHWYSTITDEQGHFAFEQIPAGNGSIGPHFIEPVRGGARHWNSYECRVCIDAGQTTRITLGAGGRAVVGRFDLPARGPQDPEWIPQLQSLRRRPPQIPPDVEEQGSDAVGVWWQAWENSLEGEAFKQLPDDYTFQTASDGSFRVDDVVPGTYALGASWVEQGTRETVADASRTLEVPALADAAPLDLESVEVRQRVLLRVGAAAPGFEAAAIDGSTMKFSELRGKYVLLHFWATWCGPCRRELPHLKQVYDAFATDERFAMIGLSLDEKPDDWRAFVRDNGMRWTQALLGKWSDTDVPERYGVRGIPAVFLIGPDGNVIAKNLSGEGIKAAVAKALSEARPSP